MSVFQHEFKDTAATGCLNEKLYDLLLDIAVYWMIDTQEIEGWHNIVRHICALAPAIQWKLLAARTGLKKELVKYDREELREWFLDQCVDHHSAAVACLRDELDDIDGSGSRYDFPTRAPGDRMAASLSGEEITSHRRRVLSEMHYKCATAVVTSMNDALKADPHKFRSVDGTSDHETNDCFKMQPSSVCVLRVDVEIGEVITSSVFFVSLSHRRQLWTVRATEDFSSGIATYADRGVVVISLPLDIEMLIEVLAKNLHTSQRSIFFVLRAFFLFCVQTQRSIFYFQVLIWSVSWFCVLVYSLLVNFLFEQTLF